jgi:hypothetical protein
VRRILSTVQFKRAEIRRIRAQAALRDDCNRDSGPELNFGTQVRKARRFAAGLDWKRYCGHHDRGRT